MWSSALEQKRMTDMRTRGRDSPERMRRIDCFRARIFICECRVMGWPGDGVC